MWRSNRGQCFVRKLFRFVLATPRPSLLQQELRTKMHVVQNHCFCQRYLMQILPMIHLPTKSNVKRNVAWFFRWLLVFTMFTEILQIKCLPKISLHLKVIANTHKKELWKSSAASATVIRHFYSRSSVIDFFLTSFIFRSVRKVMFTCTFITSTWCL